MIPLLTIWGWLLIGAALGRVLFVRVLGDQPRRERVEGRDSDGRRYTKESAWTDAFARAVWTGIACVVAWPIALPLALMLAHTGTEKLRAQRQRLQAEVARLEQEIGADRG